MATKKSVYTEAELEWAEEQLTSWKKYIDDNPLHKLADRIKLKETKTGGAIPMVIASIEQQIKAISDLMKNYLALLKEVEVMREKEEAKKAASRGDKDVTFFEQGDI